MIRKMIKVFYNGNCKKMYNHIHIDITNGYLGFLRGFPHRKKHLYFCNLISHNLKINGETPTGDRPQHHLKATHQISRSIQVRKQSLVLISTRPKLLSIYQANATEKDPILVLHSEHPHDDDQLHFIENNHNQLEASVKNLDPPFKPPVPNFEIAGSCNGFLCLYDPQDTIYLYNPLTHESIKIPPTNINFSNQKLVLGFGFHPRTKEYKIIRTAYCFPRDRPRGYGSSDTSIYTLGAKNQSWKSLGRAAYWLDRRSPMALVNGIAHWLTQRHKYKQNHEIVSFDLATEEYNKVPYPSCASFRRNFYSIVALGGYLCAFVQSNYYGEIEMWVMKDYSVKESWTKDYIIPAYSPVGLNSHKNLPDRMRDKWFIRGSVRVICLLKNGGILLEYGNQVLVSYDPEKGEFKDLNFDGLPKFFESVTVMGSLVSLQDTFNNIQK